MQARSCASVDGPKPVQAPATFATHVWICGGVMPPKPVHEPQYETHVCVSGGVIPPKPSHELDRRDADLDVGVRHAAEAETRAEHVAETALNEVRVAPPKSWQTLQ